MNPKNKIQTQANSLMFCEPSPLDEESLNFPFQDGQFLSQITLLKQCSQQCKLHGLKKINWALKKYKIDFSNDAHLQLTINNLIPICSQFAFQNNLSVLSADASQILHKLSQLSFELHQHLIKNIKLRNLKLILQKGTCLTTINNLLGLLCILATYNFGFRIILIQQDFLESIQAAVFRKYSQQVMVQCSLSIFSLCYNIHRPIKGYSTYKLRKFCCSFLSMVIKRKILYICSYKEQQKIMNSFIQIIQEDERLIKVISSQSLLKQLLHVELLECPIKWQKSLQLIEKFIHSKWFKNYCFAKKIFRIIQETLINVNTEYQLISVLSLVQLIVKKRMTIISQLIQNYRLIEKLVIKLQSGNRKLQQTILKFLKFLISEDFSYYKNLFKLDIISIVLDLFDSPQQDLFQAAFNLVIEIVRSTFLSDYLEGQRAYKAGNYHRKQILKFQVQLKLINLKIRLKNQLAQRGRYYENKFYNFQRQIY